jgi:hypothetical protein
MARVNPCPFEGLQSIDRPKCCGIVETYMSGLQPSGFVTVLTQGFALGWYIVAPLALRAVV